MASLLFQSNKPQLWFILVLVNAIEKDYGVWLTQCGGFLVKRGLCQFPLNRGAWERGSVSFSTLHYKQGYLHCRNWERLKIFYVQLLVYILNAQ